MNISLKNSENKENDLTYVTCLQRLGRIKLKLHNRGKKPQNQRNNTTPTMQISPFPLNPNSSIPDTSYPNVSLIQIIFHSAPLNLCANF